MDGVIEGGWGWVAAAWSLGLGLLATYVVALELRLRRAQRRAERLAEGER